MISRELDADAVGALFKRLLRAVGECELPGVPFHYGYLRSVTWLGQIFEVARAEHGCGG